MNHNSLYQTISSFDNLYKAYRLVRCGKRHKRIQQEYEFNLELNLVKLQRKLKNPCRYHPKGYNKFTIYEPKMREIAAPSFEDRIVHRAIFRIIEPMIRENFVPMTYACIKDRGTHKAVEDLQTSVQKLGAEDNFFLKTDIRKYFNSINHKVLKKLLRKHLNSKKTLILLNKIIDSYHYKSQKGIPLGNVTSQLFANVYLNELDHFVFNNFGDKDYPVYFRYMDDFILLSENKDFLIQTRDKIANFLKSELKLKLHSRKRLIQRIKFGIDFCGYRVFENKILLRKKTLRRFVHRWKKRKNKIEELEEKLEGVLIPNAFPEINKELAQRKESLHQSVVSHIGFLQYAKLDFNQKNYLHASKIRLPYLPKVVKLTYD